MKILVVSVFSNHLFNWVLQLKDSEYEVYWLDVHDANTYVKRIDFVHQIVKWRRIIEYPGKYWIRRNFPILEQFIAKFNTRKFEDVFKTKLEEIKPDIVHSFELHSACIPILSIMQQNPSIKWIYSAWGSDLFYYGKEPERKKEIKLVFERLNYMFADCKRDHIIAKEYDFKGEFLGVFPGGGGYDFKLTEPFLVDFDKRNLILIKGYEHKFGRCIKILQAIKELRNELKEFQIIVYGAHKQVQDFLITPENNCDNICFKESLSRQEVLKLMGQAKICIGNSISDGIPNTLLEAIIMGCFPIQSDPGGASSEIITNGKNGLLIKDANNFYEIKNLILQAISNPELLKKGIAYNTSNIKPGLERGIIQQKVLDKYRYVQHQPVLNVI